jgi:hypothetical protein
MKVATGEFMNRTAFAVVVGAVGAGAFALASCSISIGTMGQGTPPRALLTVTSSAPTVSPVSPATVSPSSPATVTSAGATYLALVGPLNTETFALDTAVFESPADLTAQSLSAVITASAAALQTFNGHLRSTTWPRTAEPDITTLAATNDVLVVVLQGYESDLQSPTPGADFNTVLQALQVDGSAYAIDQGKASDDAARVRADLGLPPPSAPQVTLND